MGERAHGDHVRVLGVALGALGSDAARHLHGDALVYTLNRQITLLGLGWRHVVQHDDVRSGPGCLLGRIQVLHLEQKGRGRALKAAWLGKGGSN